jgi:hypothetical protein
LNLPQIAMNTAKYPPAKARWPRSRLKSRRLMVMLAVGTPSPGGAAPAMELADGYPVEQEFVAARVQQNQVSTVAFSIKCFPASGEPANCRAPAKSGASPICWPRCSWSRPKLMRQGRQIPPSRQHGRL